MSALQTVDRKRLAELLKAEGELFERNHKKSKELFAQAQGKYLGGVPMNWMVRLPGTHPVFVTKAKGAHLEDIDGNHYIDFCLGDTGAMCGHAPEATVKALEEQASKGFTMMLPTQDCLVVGDELKKRFGLPLWQIAMTATDANRFSIRYAREATGRPKVLVMNWCYHGTVDETFAVLEDGKVIPRPGKIGPPVDPALTTRVVEFNDLPALEEALSHRDVACILMEPAMTNIGIIHPDPGYHKALRDLTRKYGTILIIDETHTICCGPGGFTKAYGLEPDMLVIGKPIGGGIPGAAYGMTQEVANKIIEVASCDLCDVSGVGGTLTANALSMAAMRSTLQNVLTEPQFERMIKLATRWTEGVQKVINEYSLPWSVTQLGARAEYWFRAQRPKNGGEAEASADVELDTFMHLWAMNRGLLMTPFHNMCLMCPDTTEADVDHHTKVFREAAEALLGRKPSKL